MANFSAQVSAITGASPDATELAVWLGDGAKDIIRRIVKLDPSYIKRFTEEFSVANAGLDLDDCIHIETVTRDGYPCGEINAVLRKKAATSTSFYRATDVHPVFYVLDNTLYILPAPGDDGTASVVKTKTISAADSVVDNFPDELEPLIVLFAAANHVHSMMADLEIPDEPIELVPPAIGDFSDVTETLPTYTPVAGVVLPSAPADADIDFTDVPSTPVFVPPVSGPLPSLDLGDDLSLSAFSPSSTAPDAPDISIGEGAVEALGTAPAFTAPTLSLSSRESLGSVALPAPPSSITLDEISESLPTYTAVDALTLPDVPADVNVSFDLLPDNPSFSSPSAPSYPTLGSVDDLTIADLSITATAPTPPDISVDDGGIAELISAPVFSAPVLALTALAPASEIVLPVPPEAPTFLSVSGSLPTYSSVDTVTLPDVPEDADVDFSDVPSTPSFSLPSPFAAPVIDSVEDLSISELSLSASAPSAPTISINENTVASLGDAPTFTAPSLSLSEVEEPDSIVLPAAPTAPDLDSKSESLPTYTPITVVTLPDDLSAANVDFTDVPVQPSFSFTETLSMPSPPVMLVSNDKTLTAAAEVAGIDLPTLVLTDAPEITDADIDSITAPTAPSAPSFTTPSISTGSVPVYSGPTKALNTTTAMATITSQIETNEELAMASAKINQVIASVQDYQAEIENSLNQFNEQSTKYQAELQAEIEEARLITSAESAEYQAEVQKYQAQVAAYVASVNAEVSAFASNQTQKYIDIWAAENQLAIAEYQAETAAIIQKYAQEIVSKSNLTQAEVAIYTAELSRMSMVNQSNIGLFNAAIASAVQEFSANLNESVQNYQSELQLWMGEVDKSIKTYQAETGYDIGVYSSKINGLIQKQIQDIDNENREFQAGVSKYVAETQSVSESNNSKLQKYASELNRYSIEVNSALQKWSLEEVQGRQVRFLNERSTDIQKYQSDIQNALADFNAENVEYQVDLQKKIQDASNTLESEVATAQAELGKYARELEQYQIDVNAEVQEYLQRDVQSVLTEWMQKRQDAISKFQIEYSGLLQEYASKLQGSVAEYQASFSTWQGLIDKAIAEYQAETGYDLGRYKVNVDAVIASHLQGVGNEASEFQAGLQKYMSEVEYVISTNTSRVNKFNAEVNRYSAEVNGELQRWALREIQNKQAKWVSERTTDIQKYQVDIQNALAEFNDANIEYQADLQVKMQEASNLMASDSAEVQANLAKYSGELEQYRIDVTSEVQEYLQKDVQAELAIWVQKRQDAMSEFQTKYTVELQEYGSSIQLAYHDYAAALEVWRGHLQKSLNTYQLETGYDLGKYTANVDAIINEHVQAINNESAEFGANLQNYVAEVQSVANANNHKIAKLNADINVYAAESNNALQKWMLEEYRAKHEKWVTERTTDIQKYQMDIQNAVAAFNRDVVEYQSDLQVKIQEAANALTSDAEQARQDIASYVASIGKYREQINYELQEYLSKDVQAELTSWIEERRNALSEYQVASSNVLTAYATDLQKSFREFEASSGVWQGEIGKAINKYQAETGYDLAKYRTQVEAEVSRLSAALQEESTSFSVNVNKFLADLQRVSEINNRTLTKYAQELQEYQLNITEEIQRFSAKLNRYQVQYNSYLDQYNRLMARYEAGFLVYAKQE